MEKRDVTFLLLVTVIWGVSFTVMKIGVVDMPPLFVCALRFLFTVFPGIFFVKKPDIRWSLIALYGLFLGGLAFGLVFMGLKLGMGAALSSVVMQTQALFTIILAAIIFHERIRRHQMVACGVSFAGLAVLGYTQATPTAIVPFLMIGGAALCWGISNIITKKAGSVNMLAFVVYSSIFGTLGLLALSFVVEGGRAIMQATRSIDLTTVFVVVYLAGAATLFGFSVWSRMMQKYPAALVAPFSLVVPVSGMLSAVVFLGEEIHMAEIAGMALIFTGLLINIATPKLYAKFTKG